MHAERMLCSVRPLVKILNYQLYYLLSSPSLGRIPLRVTTKSSSVTTNDSHVLNTDYRFSFNYKINGKKEFRK